MGTIAWAAFAIVVSLGLSVVGFFFIMGVVNYMASGGDQQKAQQGIAGMRGAIVGAVLIGTASLFINFMATDIIRPAGGHVGHAYDQHDCDWWLRYHFVTKPFAAANAENANQTISTVQEHHEECGPQYWNPWVLQNSNSDARFTVLDTATNTTQYVFVPDPLKPANLPKDPDMPFRTPNPVRVKDSSQGGNAIAIGIVFADAGGTQRGHTVTRPLDGAERWMLHNAVWYTSVP